MKGIALDIMGGDHAPDEVIKGVKEALEESSSLKLFLVGPEKWVQKGIEKVGVRNLDRVEIVDAPEFVTMKDSLFNYWRGKQKSTIKVGLQLVKEGITDGFFSAGNTGAVMVNARLILEPLEGVERPALAVLLPTDKGFSLIVDAGANSDCRPTNLLQFAHMGTVFMEEFVEKKNPTVGLISIGEEDSKGNRLTKESFRLFSQKVPNFVGNIEGNRIIYGSADILVSDGFTGNVTLKVAEGVAENLLLYFRNAFMKNLLTKLAALVLSRSVKKLKKRLDYSEYGGAILLGVKGIAVIGHGRSKAKAIKNGILATKGMVEKSIHLKIQERMGELNLDV